MPSRPPTRPPGAPNEVQRDYTPVPIDTSVFAVHDEIKKFRTEMRTILQENSNDHSEADLVISTKKAQKVWTIMTIIGTVLAAVAGVGAGYAALKDAVAMDEEVKASIEEHNEDSASHPSLVETVRKAGDAIEQTSSAMEQISRDQCEQKKRSEYQFAFSRWQSELIECERKRCRSAPSKPVALQNMESDLIMGKINCP